MDAATGPSAKARTRSAWRRVGWGGEVGSAGGQTAGQQKREPAGSPQSVGCGCHSCRPGAGLRLGLGGGLVGAAVGAAPLLIVHMPGWAASQGGRLRQDQSLLLYLEPK